MSAIPHDLMPNTCFAVPESSSSSYLKHVFRLSCASGLSMDCPRTVSKANVVPQPDEKRVNVKQTSMARRVQYLGVHVTKS